MSDEHDPQQEPARPKQHEISGRKRDSFYANLRKASPAVDSPAKATTAHDDEDDER